MDNKVKSRIKHIITALLLAAAFTFAILGLTTALNVKMPAASAEPAVHTHEGWTATSSLPDSAGSYYLTDDVAISGTWNVPSGTTNLCLNGHGIIGNSGNSVIYVGNGTTLNIYDCGTTEHRFTVSTPRDNGSGAATVDDTLTEGYKTFKGGYVTGGKSSYGAGVNMSGGTVNWYGGNLIGNTSPKDGGAVHMDGNSVFTMYGGSVQYNYGDTGGGFFVENGSAFTLEGGTIAYNTNGARGAAIFTRGTVRIHGGEIVDNYNWSEQTFALWGGTIEITGGVIKGNLHNASGVMTLSTLSLGGNPVIKDNKDGSNNTANLYVKSGGIITMVDALADSVKDNKIGVTMQSGKGQLTQGWADYMPADAEPADYFVSENADYEILRIKGEARLVKEPYTLINFAGGDQNATGFMEKDILEDGETSFTLPTETTFKLAGKALFGWRLGDIVYAPGEIVTLGSDNVTFTAVWTDGFTVSFDAKGGNEFESKCILPNTAVANPGKPKKDGYTFLYWTLNGEEYDFSAPVTEDITLKALWAQGVSVGESFEGGVLPDGWMTSGDYQFGVSTGASNGGEAHQGAKNALASVDSYGGTAWLIMPETDLSKVVSVPISFWYKNPDWDGDTDVVGLYYRINGGDWQEIFSDGSSHGDWTKWSGELPEEALVSGVEIAFKAESNYGYGVCIDDVVIEAITPHTHDWTYAADGNVITATCSGMEDGTCLYEAQTVTITAEDKEYDGEPVTATVTKSANWDAYSLAEIGEVVYSGNTTAGDYTASITAGGATAVANFTVVSVNQHEHDGVTFTAWTSTTSLPTEAGNYYLANDVTISSTWSVPSGTTNLCLNGYAIIRTNASDTTGSVIQVGSGAALNLYDCGEETRYYVVENPSVNGAGLGVVVEKDVYDAADENARGTFVGGYITGGAITGAADNAHLIGGGVNVNGGAFTMNGGTIIGNKVCINGGAIKLKGAGASFTMNGGALIANYNDCYGGAISVGDNNGSRLCTLTINGGTIARNWSGRNGGAIHFDNYAHTFVLTGGTIVNNYTNGNFESLGRSGGGILVDGATLQLSGDPVVKNNMQGAGLDNNIYIRTNSKIINLGNGLSADADVGICTKEASASTDVKIAVNASTEDVKRLHFDVESDGCLVFCDGENDWIYVNGEKFKLGGAHHTHEANTVWACVDPVAVVTAGEEITYFCSFDAALSAWSDGGTLKLFKDVNARITVTDGNKTLDLNDHSITYTSGTVIVVSGGSLRITDQSGTKTTHYYTPNTTGVATLSNTDTGYSFEGGFITGGVNNNNRGGGISVSGTGSVLFDSGTIFANQAGWGGGIWTSGTGSLTIEGTAAIIGNYSSGSYTSGGGIFMEGSCAVTMTGGSIRHNSAQFSGGGVRDCIQESTGVRFTMTGGEITGNYSDSNQGNGFCFDMATTFNIGGTARIVGNQGTNDLYLYNERYLTVVAPFEEGAMIGVTLQSGTGVFTNSSNVAYNDPTKFVSDNASYIVGKNAAGQLLLGAPCTLAYNANGGSGSMDSAVYASGSEVTVAENAFTSEGFTFFGWNTAADGSGTPYAAGDTFDISANVTLYAMWAFTLFDGKGMEAEPYLIKTSDDWDTLSNYINEGGTGLSGKYFKLTDDITVTTMLGFRPDTSDSNDRVFSGVFDGDGHTLTVNIDTSLGFAAPFAIVHNTTIKNLHVAGKVKSTGVHASGLVGATKASNVNGDTTLTVINVIVSVDVTASSHVAGVIGHAHKAIASMENVVFDGNISASSMQGGFVGWGGTGSGGTFKLTLKDCLFLGTFSAGVAFHPVAYASGQGTVSLLNDFYTMSLGSGGSPVATTGDGTVKLIVASVTAGEKETYYGDIASALTAWADGTTLKLYQDVETTAAISLSTGEYTLDLNGYGILMTGNDRVITILIQKQLPHCLNSMLELNYIQTAENYLVILGERSLKAINI
ncbi:MAG: InlB B-repeat-containing protein [Clostridia bacterium]|nr:InlB B-repeat-containing protein [Clostridia bacterium]